MSKKATFWISPTGMKTFRIHLKDGERREFSGFWYTDEGHDSFHSSFTREGRFIRRIETTDGRDCDGRMSTYRELFCTVDRLSQRRPFPEKPRVRFPEWTTTDSQQRDYEAEKAGY